MRKAQNVAFAVITAAFLSITGISAILASFQITEAPERSYLEGRVFQGQPILSNQSFANRVFQSESEQYLADSVPYRDEVLLANAAVQRSLISCANTVFGYDAYHTFFDSRYTVDVGAGCINEIPYKISDYEENVKTAVELYDSLYEAHPEINCLIAMVDRTATYDDNPAHNLVSNVADYDYFYDKLESALGNKWSLVNTNEIRKEFDERVSFKTDHHWKVQGSFEVYREITQRLGRTPISEYRFETVYEGPFYGAMARNALVTDYSDSVDDIIYGHGDIKAVADGKKRKASYINYGWNEKGKPYSKPHRFMNVYADYFHNDAGIIVMDNEQAPEGTLLVIGDSFTNNFDRIFCEHWRRVIVVDFRYYEGNLESLLAEHDVDDLALIMGPNNLFSQVTIDKL